MACCFDHQNPQLFSSKSGPFFKNILQFIWNREHNQASSPHFNIDFYLEIMRILGRSTQNFRMKQLPIRQHRIHLSFFRAVVFSTISCTRALHSSHLTASLIVHWAKNPKLKSQFRVSTMVPMETINYRLSARNGPR